MHTDRRLITLVRKKEQQRQKQPIIQALMSYSCTFRLGSTAPGNITHCYRQ